MTIYRQALSGDINQLLDIEYESLKEHLGKDYFTNALKQYKIIVAEVNRRVVGYMVYYTGPELVQLFSIAVKPEYQRQKIGTSLLHYLSNYNKPIEVHVPDYALGTQLFFKANGFKCQKIIREYFEFGDSFYFLKNHS